MSVKLAHRLVGWGFVLVFLGTGQSMRLGFPGGEGLEADVRWMMRSAHVYILFAALLNVTASGWGDAPLRGWRRALRTFGAGALLLAPAVLTAAFFLDHGPGRLARPWVLAGVVLAASGSVSYSLAAWRSGSKA